MDLQEQLQRVRAWAFNLEQWPQKAMWATLAVIAGYLLGLVIARLLAFAARKIGGLARRGKAEPAARTADHVMIDILGSVTRALILAGSLAVAADILGFYDIRDAQSVALAALKGMLIVVAVWFLGAWLSRRVRGFGDKVARGSASGGQTLFVFISSLVRFGALAVGLIAALQQFGFPIASLVAVVGAAGLAIALALQDTLKAVAAGVVIAVFRPYRIGDAVRIAGEDGVVADITPFTTVLNTVDNREIVVTNDKAWGDVIVNHSIRSLRRLDILFSIDYDDDIDLAIRVIKKVIEADPRVRAEPPVWCKVVDLAAYSVDIRARAWCANADWLDLNCDMLKEVKQAMDRNGLTIPYPHQTAIEKYPRAAPVEAGGEDATGDAPVANPKQRAGKPAGAPETD
ncbi:MAG: mechanosensitive ion channel family protein [Alphaproteobacteria bacterium]|nr:mechanosensitive ion channel family protein [Alphaproteobacteria bacterium]